MDKHTQPKPTRKQIRFRDVFAEWTRIDLAFFRRRGQKLGAEPARTVLHKTALIGSEKVGKSSLWCRFKENTFEEEHITDYGPQICVALWNTLYPLRSIDAAKTQYWAMPSGKVCKDTWNNSMSKEALTLFFARRKFFFSSLLRGSSSVAVVYSVHDRSSFDAVTRVWLPALRAELRDKADFVLVANQVDNEGTQREISRAEGRALAKELGFSYIETSAKTGHNVEKLFAHLATRALGDLQSLIQPIQPVEEEQQGAKDLEEVEASGPMESISSFFKSLF